MKGNVEPHILLSLVTCLPVSAHPQHRSLIEEKLTNIQPPVTFENIWSILNLYWDYLNYGLLQHVINKCGSKDLKQQMQDYVDELSTFKQTTRLCEFIESRTWQILRQNSSRNMASAQSPLMVRTSTSPLSKSTLYRLYPKDPGRPPLNTPRVPHTAVEGHHLQRPPHRCVQAILGPVQNGL